MHQSGSATGDTISIREANTLGLFTARGLLRYKDDTAFVCKSCNCVINVQCPRCGSTTERYFHGDFLAPIIRTDKRTLEKSDSRYWTQVECLKCSYLFKVIYR